MPKYKVHYSEEACYYKVFEAKSSKEATYKAQQELLDNGWDTSNWETGHGGGGEFLHTEEV